MSLRLCPDCDHHHRGRCVVCRPCAHKRLVTYSGARLFAVSRETVPVEARNAAVLSNIEDQSAWSDIIPDHAADLANAGLADELGASHG